MSMHVNFRLLDFDHMSEPTIDDMIAAGKDLDLAQKIYEYIIGKAPRGIIIRVEVTTRGGIAKLSHMLMPPSTCYVIHLKDLANEYGWKKLMRAVGLLLEIFDLPRSCYNADFFREIFRERSKQHRNEKLGIFKREVNLATGQSKLVMPDYMGAR